MASSKINTFDLEDPVVEALNTIDTVADSIGVIDGKITTIDSNVDKIYDNIIEVTSNVQSLTNRLTADRAGYLDLLNNSTYGLNAIKTAVSGNGTALGTVNTNVSSIKTATDRLTSTRAGYIDLLGNSTNGLAAIKTAINNVNTTVGNAGGTYAIGAFVKGLEYNVTESFEYPVFINAGTVGTNTPTSMSIGGAADTHTYGWFLLSAGITVKSGSANAKVYRAVKI